MKYLLDTHAIIWMIDNSAKIPRRIKEITNMPQNEFYISAVSLWEIVLKMNLGKLELKSSFEELLAAVKTSDFVILQIEDVYLNILLELPLIHKDPFDRLIIASAIVEDLTIITADNNIQKYDVQWIW